MYGLLSVGSGNFLEWYYDEADARRALLGIVMAEPEAIPNLAIVPFDKGGHPTGGSITAAMTKCQGNVKLFTVPASASCGGEG